MAKLFIEDLDLGGKRVIMRVDFNVPVKDGKVENDKRLRASLPSIQYVLGKGASLVLMSPFEFVMDPLRWLWAFTRHGGTISTAPNFGYALCVRTRRSAVDESTLQLGTWRVAMCGAEPVSAENLGRFASRWEARDDASAGTSAQCADHSWTESGRGQAGRAAGAGSEKGAHLRRVSG